MKEPAVLTQRKSLFCFLYLTKTQKLLKVWCRRWSFDCSVPHFLFPATLNWPPPWCARARAARRCVLQTARSTCIAPTERLSPSPTPTWRSVDAHRQTARLLRMLVVGEASHWSDMNSFAAGVLFSGMWWFFFFFFAFSGLLLIESYYAALFLQLLIVVVYALSAIIK